MALKSRGKAMVCEGMSQHYTAVELQGIDWLRHSLAKKRSAAALECVAKAKRGRELQGVAKAWH